MRLKRLLLALCATGAVIVLGVSSTPATAATCDDEYTGQEEIMHPGRFGWAYQENWSNKEIPLAGQVGCIPESWGLPVNINLSLLPHPYEIGGVKDQSPAPLEITANTTVLTDAARPSAIKNLDLSGDGFLQVGSGNELTLATATAGGSATGLLGPGTIRIPTGATLNLIERGPSFGDALQLLNSGTINVGHEGGPTLESASGTPARLVNTGTVAITGRASIGRGAEEPGPELINDGNMLVNETLADGVAFVNHGTVAIAPGKLFEVPSITGGGTVAVGTGAFSVQSAYEPVGNPVISLEIVIVKKKGKKHPEEHHVGSI
ncbi:MAG TPA: hypothetical protein VGX51_09370, partial [Solirubrobacteraceae bacterium]|nr:hypothetical protein [Solirubrobacteraceae bacterium]